MTLNITYHDGQAWCSKDVDATHFADIKQCLADYGIAEGQVRIQVSVVTPLNTLHAVCAHL